MKVAIRTDASRVIGSGHVVRCKTLADELRRRGAEILFVCRDHPGNLIGLLQSEGYAVGVLPAAATVDNVADESYASWLGTTPAEDAQQTIDAVREFAPDWLIADHYALDRAWESLLRMHAKRIAAIDDLANRAHDCDLLLDQNWFGAQTATRYRGLVPDQCLRLLGPRHALLQPAFAALRNRKPPCTGTIKRVLVFFGGVDSHGQTVKALQALGAPEFADIAVDIVIGHTNRRESEIVKLAANRTGTQIHRQLPSLAGLMEQADLMLGAGGTTTWERCCAGLPAIVVSAAENQAGFTAALGDAGVHCFIGAANVIDADDWAASIRALRKDPARVRAYAVASSRITDGLGALRVAAGMHQQQGPYHLRRATPADETLLLDWANDPDVRRNAFSPDLIHPDTHHAWLGRKLTDPDCLLLIGEDAYGLPVGQVRFDLGEDAAMIDISVERLLRGHRLGDELLRGALEVLRQENRSRIAIGEVIAGNDASANMFLRLGFNALPANPARSGVLRFAFDLTDTTHSK